MLAKEFIKFIQDNKLEEFTVKIVSNRPYVDFSSLDVDILDTHNYDIGHADKIVTLYTK
jgi:hypothetical protein